MASTRKLPVNKQSKPLKFHSLSSPNQISFDISFHASTSYPNNQLGYPSFSELLEGVVMAANSSVSSHPSLQTVGFHPQFGMSHREALASVTAKAAQAQAQAQARTQLQTEAVKPSAEPPPTTQAESCVPSSSVIVQESPSTKEIVDKQEGDEIPRTPISDGYSWRKYGQKQVKSSGSSRSYYRCTYLNCFVKKKVEHMDISGQIVAVVYKGNHNHGPPQNLKGSSRKKSTPSVVPFPLNDSICGTEGQQAVALVDECRENDLNSSASISQRDCEEQHIKTLGSTQRLESQKAILPAQAEHVRSSNPNELAMNDPMKQHDIAPLKKRRIKERGKACPDSIYRNFKEPKVVVHAAAGDVGISSDGYKWRKYGQKMVKGNPHPRSYYRCSSGGCPVRKHVERATDNSTAMMVTYEGKHNHDMPVPRKHGSPNSSVVTAASDMSENKVLESARTLLSIGIELKSC